MFFDLANIPATLPSYINKCLAEKLDIFVIVYLDNILIYTNKKSAKFKKAIKWILEQLQKYDLYINFKKCCFSTDKIHFLNYIILPSGVYIESKRIDSMKN